MLKLAHDQGYHATRRMLDHAILRGYVPRPATSGNYRWFSSTHAAAFCAYLRDHSRAQSQALPEGGEA